MTKLQLKREYKTKINIWGGEITHKERKLHSQQIEKTELKEQTEPDFRTGTITYL